MGQNLGFLFRYQMGHMYWRYFLWNFVGRESDVQQAGVVSPLAPAQAACRRALATARRATTSSPCR